MNKTKKNIRESLSFKQSRQFLIFFPGARPVRERGASSSAFLGEDPLHDGGVAASRWDESVVVGQELDPGHLGAVAAAGVIKGLKKFQKVELRNISKLSTILQIKQVQ
jgi:hypothetical protein